MSDTVILAIIALASPIAMGSFVFFTQRANKREDWRRQDVVAGLVEKVAVKAEASSKTLDEIKTVSDATHALVNSGRTVHLRTIAVSMRTIATLQPNDPAAQAAADAAEKDLKQNEIDNAAAAQIKKAADPYADAEKQRRGN